MRKCKKIFSVQYVSISLTNLYVVFTVILKLAKNALKNININQKMGNVFNVAKIR